MYAGLHRTASSRWKITFQPPRHWRKFTSRCCQYPTRWWKRRRTKEPYGIRWNETRIRHNSENFKKKSLKPWRRERLFHSTTRRYESWGETKEIVESEVHDQNYGHSQQRAPAITLGKQLCVYLRVERESIALTSCVLFRRKWTSKRSQFRLIMKVYEMIGIEKN